jgi:hypothetical protein
MVYLISGALVALVAPFIYSLVGATFNPEVAKAFDDLLDPTKD